MELTEEVIQNLIKEAQKGKSFSYSPYSHFPVGAAILTKSGKIYNGCNVENASYGGAICAERTTCVKAVSDGEKEFEAIAICSNMDDYITPCGFCRQFLVEFGTQLKVIETKYRDILKDETFKMFNQDIKKIREDINLNKDKKNIELNIKNLEIQLDKIEKSKQKSEENPKDSVHKQISVNARILYTYSKLCAIIEEFQEFKDDYQGDIDVPIKSNM